MQTSAPTSSYTINSAVAVLMTMGKTMSKERSLMGRNDTWHRIKIINGAKYDKEIVLRSILAAVEPADLIPVVYQINGADAYFMARNCGPALETLCRCNLIISISETEWISLVITLAYASIHQLKINIQPILLAALTRCYDSALKYLKLDDFHTDPELSKTVYCPLSQPKTLGHTLKLARTALGPLECLNLQYNHLTSLTAMETLNLTSLRVLDIRNNDIYVMNVLSSLKNLDIKELWLDGNPVCENYYDAERYIESVKLYCPNLQKLDGIDLNSPAVLRMSRDNYYKEDSESGKIVKQFLTHFFNIYDSKDRLSLGSLYRKNSLYSLTLGAPMNIHKRKFIPINYCPFTPENRNILGSLDSKDLRKLLRQGTSEIVATFKRLPETLHDKRNFHWDVMFEDRQRILVSVEGRFISTFNSISSLYGFTRTFLLTSNDHREYHILNDQLYVVLILPVTTLPYKFDAGKSMKKNDNDTQEIFTPREKEQMICTLMEITTMNTEWCHRFLNDSNWDVRKAIKKFMDNYKLSNIPAEAFRK